MIAYLDVSNVSSSLKPNEKECELVLDSTPSDTSVLYQDEMTRSVPSLKSHSSQEFLPCSSASFSAGRRNSRKGRPYRSCSWQDSSPGVLFKFNDMNQSILVVSNDKLAITQEPIAMLTKSMARLRSQSITSLNEFSHFPPASSRSFRPRSFSIDAIGFLSSRARQTPQHAHNSFSSSQEIAEEESSTSDDARDSIPRKSSMSGSCGSSQSMRKKVSSISNSLSHLVPNKLLSTMSRRISAHSVHELCRCSSCNQAVTPYWRDGWSEDVMLCNACGLRFQKFAQRCLYCKYIPRKEDGVEDTCPQCQAPWEC